MKSSAQIKAIRLPLTAKDLSTATTIDMRKAADATGCGGPARPGLP